MSRFATKKATTKTVNKAGGYAFKHAPEMELIVSSLSTFLEDKFYEKGSKRIERLQHLCGLVKPEFLGKLAVVARNQFHMRSVSHLLVGELAKNHRGDDLVKRVIEKVAERPDDLIEIVAYLDGKIPKQVKRGVRHALLKFSRYQLSKYKNEGNDVKLVDLFNACHPNPKFANDEQKRAWKDLIEGNLKNEETWEARLSSGEDKAKVWKDLIMENKLGYMALLRNLRNVSTQADKETQKKAASIIADREAVAKSKQLPFRFYNAYENVTERIFLDAVAQAMEHSVSNVPQFDGKTLIAVDVSGSMNGDPVKKASIFASALYKANDADIILYSTSVKEMKVTSLTPVIEMSKSIQEQAMGGGTETSLVFEYAFRKNKGYNRIIILSDNESWVESYMGTGVNATYNDYKKATGADPFVYAIDIQGYGTKDVTGNRVFHLAGWSEKIFDYMYWIEKENQLVDFINKIEL